MSARLPQISGRRFAFIVFLLIISFHFLLTILFKEYDSIPSLYRISDRFGLTTQEEEADIQETLFEQNNITSISFLHSNLSIHEDPVSTNANATFVLLCRNSDLAGVLASIQQVEDRFNRNRGYPWVLLNEEPFTEEFKRRVSVLVNSSIQFGQIPAEHWFQPDWIDEEKAKAGRIRMMAQGIIYAGSVPYRNMCRFNSGFFFQHELLKPYRYYWRVEPDVKYFCDVDYDPFKFMEENQKVYGFTISLVEWEATIPTLWSAVKEFISENPHYVDPNNSMEFLSDNNGDTYNLCHYWSNFEIADMDFWRGEAYQKFFDFLEAKGGFYYERWGDAPVHSIAASLFAAKDQVHFFRDIGYRHSPFQHCPIGEKWVKGKCSCDPNDSFDYVQNSCLKKYEDMFW
uniref:Glycosyltransferase family 15 protein n=1 Tax=Psilocybe cubensis TaxID=181762 RepID=A0A8H7Y2M3_PSICU